MHYLAGGLFADYAHQWEYLKVVFMLGKLELKIRRLRNYRDWKIFSYSLLTMKHIRPTGTAG